MKLRNMFLAGWIICGPSVLVAQSSEEVLPAAHAEGAATQPEVYKPGGDVSPPEADTPRGPPIHKRGTQK